MNIPVDLTGKELENFQPGVYSFIVSSVEPVTDESGAVVTSLQMKLSCTTAPYMGKPLFHRIWLPKESDTADQVYSAKKRLKGLCNYFKVPMTEGGFDHEAFIGKSCSALIVSKETESGVFDSVSKWV